MSKPDHKCQQRIGYLNQFFAVVAPDNWEVCALDARHHVTAPPSIKSAWLCDEHYALWVWNNDRYDDWTDDRDKGETT